jgi:hypothetical protein
MAETLVMLFFSRYYCIWQVTTFVAGICQIKPLHTAQERAASGFDNADAE